MAYIELLDAYEYYLSIQQLWKPEKYLFSVSCINAHRNTYSVYKPSISHAKLIFSYFVSTANRYTFSTKERDYSIPRFLLYLRDCIGSPITWSSKIEALTKRFLDRAPNGLSERKNARLSVYDLLGTMLMQKPLTEKINLIDVASLPKGIYVIKISGADWSVQSKLIKQ